MNDVQQRAAAKHFAEYREGKGYEKAYGMPVKTTTESSCVAELMRRYQALTAAEEKE